MPLDPQRYRAPKADGAVLAVPPLDEADALLAANAERLRGWDHDFQGRDAARLRSMARAQLLRLAAEHHRAHGLDLPAAPEPSAPWVLTGHQPELFHPGVWVKNFAVAGVAGRSRAVGLNLIVDNDIPKSAAIRVPTGGGHLRTQAVPFDEWAGEVPYEDWRVKDESVFASFPDRVRATLGGLIADPLIDAYAPCAAEAAATTDRLGLRFAGARRRVEAGWGARNWEVPLGRACETEAFGYFACHLLAHLPRYQEVHNRALHEYRRVHKIRSKNHPVADLRGEGDWLEAPLWAWRAESPRRRPLMARQRARTMELRIAGEDAPFLTVPLGPDRDACCAVEELQGLPARGIRVRTRALTTTMFARFLVGDLFFHGIGGAKYDELGDEVARAFLGVEPPAYATLSMTAWLGLGADGSTPGRLSGVERALRDLAYNPDRALGTEAPVGARAWVAAKAEAVAGPVATRRQRVERFAQIRRCNDALSIYVESRRAALLAERAALAAAERRNAVARGRDFAWVLHGSKRLESALGGLFAPGK